MARLKDEMQALFEEMELHVTMLTTLFDQILQLKVRCAILEVELATVFDPEFVVLMDGGHQASLACRRSVLGNEHDTEETLTVAGANQKARDI